MESVEVKIDQAIAEIRDLREEVRVGFAKLPSAYVPRGEFNRLRQEAQNARRWAIGLGVPSLIGIIGLIVNIL
jgi:hypothetical protein